MLGLIEDLRVLAGRSLVRARPSAGRALAIGRAKTVDAAIHELAGDLGPTALVAVGGYGRGELSPGSDVDLVLLHPEGAHDRAAEAFARILYPLWDAGFRVGHAMRTPEECIRLASESLDILAPLLTSRLIRGAGGLLRQVRRGAAEMLALDRRTFVGGLGRWRDDRVVRSASLGEALEPDLKEGSGGLRDLHLLWLLAGPGGARPFGTPLPALTGAGLLSDEEAGWCREAVGFLLLVREALQRRTGDSSNVLAADLHADVAADLGIPRRPDWEPRDGLQRRVALHGRRVALATTAALDRAEFEPDHVARHAGAGGPAVASSTGTGGEDGVLELLRTQRGRERLIELALRGELPRMLPAWDGVMGRPQRDPYHRRPVDLHLVQTVQEAGRLLDEPGDPLSVELLDALDDPVTLMLGALLHDIGKLGRGSHVDSGVEVAGQTLDRLGVTDRTRSDVVFLVREHLLLANTAVRRNLEDEDLVLHVAARIGDRRRLAMLHALTLADARATGPAACTPWRMALLRELTAKVASAFDRGSMDSTRAGRIEGAEDGLRRSLLERGVRPSEAEAFLARMPAAYLLSASAEDVADHLTLLTPPPRRSGTRFTVREGAVEGTWTLAVGAADRLGLLAAIAGSLAVAGLSVLSARVHTTEDGCALDLFDVRGSLELDADVGADHWERFRQTLRAALDGDLDLGEAIRDLRGHYRRRRPRATAKSGEDQRHHPAPLDVRLDQAGSGAFTVVEVGAADRVGLLYDLAWAFARAEIDVHSAMVATYAERVVDVFYVTGADGGKVLEPGRVSALTSALRAAAG